MSGELRFDGKVAIVTGAGGGLGKSHALLLASRGAKVVVNDLGGSAFGDGKSTRAADVVVEEIKKAGGTAVANYDSVENGEGIVKTALDAFGQLDIVINNAGILRDTTFHKMKQEDWDLIYKVHVLGSFRVTHAAWNHMRDKGYGRIVFTASAAGIYGNFGQVNYGSAKLALLGMSNSLALEGKKKNVLVNTIAPIAGSRLTETVLPKELIDALKPEYVSPLVAYLCHESCTDTGGVYEVGGGFLAKLRWERSVGHTFRVGRAITLEGIADAWKDVTSFEKSTHPQDIAQSMAPIMENIQAGPSKGGNQYIDVDRALGYEFPPIESSYDERDLSIYALGIGAAHDPLDDKDLSLVYEMHRDGFKSFPTFAVMPAMKSFLERAKSGENAPGMNYGFDRLLHGEQYTEITRPLPEKAKLKHRAKVKDIFDKGKNAVVVNEVKSYDENGDLLIVNEFTSVIRGAGGWGGDRGPTGELNAAPDRKPDAIKEEKIPDNQALLYRLSGDWNPLHADPAFATAFGFPRPILHGLCTFGYAARHVVSAFQGGDPRKFKSIKVRFADSVFPGETIITEMWKESDTKILFRCRVKEREKVVISNAAIEFFSEIPKPKEKKKTEAPAAAAAAPVVSAEPIAADVFRAIEMYIEQNAAMVGQIGNVFLFKLTNPNGAWVVDLKNGKGAVSKGEGKADCTLELTDADFMAMCTGKADPQKLYFGGKLKISGNVMASQKLEFLKKMDPALGLKAMQERLGSSAPAAAAPAPAPASNEANSADIFVAIRHHVETHPELVKSVGNVFQFKLTNPESAWLIDVKNGSGSVTQGTGTADVTLELSDADFIAMSTGKADPQKLYFGGKLKISGNVMASQKLEFLKKVDPEAAKAAVMAARKAASGAPAQSASPTTSTASRAKTLFAKLAERLASNAALAKEINAVIQVNVKSPDSSWTIDLTGPGAVREGTAKDAATTLTLEDACLADLSIGTAPAVLFQQGKLRVDGKMQNAHKLGFFKGLI